MLNTIRTMALSALVGLSALAAMPAVAQADSIYLGFGGGNGSRFGVYEGSRDHGIRHVHRDRHHERNRHWRRSCSTDRALDKAERMGLRRARVVHTSRRTVKVAGLKYGTRVSVVFGNERGCPVVYR